MTHLAALEDISSQVFLGKEDLLFILENDSLNYVGEEKGPMQDYIERYARYQDRGPLSEHEKYLQVTTKAIVERMTQFRDSECIMQLYTQEPFYQHGLYISSSGHEIMGFIKGYDIKKTPEIIWNKAWGMINA